MIGCGSAFRRGQGPPRTNPCEHQRWSVRGASRPVVASQARARKLPADGAPPRPQSRGRAQEPCVRKPLPAMSLRRSSSVI